MIQSMVMLIRRELWEHKALYVTPLVVAGLIVFGFLMSFITLIFNGVSFNGAVAALEMTGAPASLAGGAALIGVPAGVLNLTLAAVVFFYAIDALYAERKDRSILFWRSLPVSDTETVLSKLATAVVVAPLIAAAVAIATQLILLVLATFAVWLGGGNPIELLWGPLPFVQMWILLTYLFLTASLWFAPIVAWFLLCSAFARRSVLIWVAVPWLIAMMLEGIVLRSGHVFEMIRRRLSDALPNALEMPGLESLDDSEMLSVIQNGDLNALELMAPLKFLTSAGLWTGLVAAALFTAAAIYFRRFRA